MLRATIVVDAVTIELTGRRRKLFNCKTAQLRRFGSRHCHRICVCSRTLEPDDVGRRFIFVGGKLSGQVLYHNSVRRGIKK